MKPTSHALLNPSCLFARNESSNRIDTCRKCGLRQDWHKVKVIFRFKLSW